MAFQGIGKRIVTGAGASAVPLSIGVGGVTNRRQSEKAHPVPPVFETRQGGAADRRD